MGNAQTGRKTGRHIHKTDRDPLQVIFIGDQYQSSAYSFSLREKVAEGRMRGQLAP
jgi:hypothetical protein